MKLPTPRPEDRSRSSSAEPPSWGDTLPACFRSEGFAEDLPEAPAALAVQAPAFARRVDRRQADGQPAWGLTMAGMFGLAGR